MCSRRSTGMPSISRPMSLAGSRLSIPSASTS
nr:MAG TPA_asm: hypothetical protein [Caudoviricetes sp.]